VPSLHPLSPDLARARRLLAGGSVPRRASLYFCGEPANLRIARIVRANLRPLGIRVTITESLDCLRGHDPKARRADLLLVTRATPLLDPAPFLHATVGDTAAFGGGFGFVTWDDAAFRRRLRAARALTGEARLAAYRGLEDDLLRGEAPYAAFASFASPEYLSARTGCRVVQGAYGVVDLAALCVRGRG
jgi:ABC-type transport system substrate-binding protein